MAQGFRGQLTTHSCHFKSTGKEILLKGEGILISWSLAIVLWENLVAARRWQAQSNTFNGPWKRVRAQCLATQWAGWVYTILCSWWGRCTCYGFMPQAVQMGSEHGFWSDLRLCQNFLTYKTEMVPVPVVLAFVKIEWVSPNKLLEQGLPRHSQHSVNVSYFGLRVQMLKNDDDPTVLFKDI